MRWQLASSPPADLGGVGPRPDVALNAHPAGDLSGGAAHVDVVALVAALCEPLDDGGLPTTRGELVGECRPGNAGAGD